MDQICRSTPIPASLLKNMMKMMKKVVIVLVLMTCLFCSCGNRNNAEAPILNENGKEEIVLCDLGVSGYMQNAIVSYNKQSDKYEVVVRERLEGVSTDDFRRNIQLELTNGKGPDILFFNCFTDCNIFPCAEDGYLMDVTDFLNEQTDIIDIAKGYNELNGRIYAVPVNMVIHTVCTFERYEIEQKDNTLKYWMTLTEDTNTEFDWNGVNLLRMLGVGVDGIQLFVDEENGKSNFEQKEFVELLEFAKKYGYKDIGETIRERVASGKQIFWETSIQSFEQFWFQEAAFKELPSYIGYPTNQGGRHKLSCLSYAINNASKHKDGALDFLSFLLSDEQQQLSLIDVEGFPVRKSILTKLWDEALQEPYTGDAENKKTLAYSVRGVYYEPRKMNEEEAAIFWEMLNNPLYNYNYNPICEIVAEETHPFFNDKKAAEEVAKVIDNRVQLYLNETN